MRVQSGTVAQIIGGIARRQHGVVARRQLVAVGVPSNSIARRLRTGALIAVYPGVYRAGHAAPSMHATYMTAVLACGEGAVLAGQAAARLLGLIRRGQPAPEVIAPSQRKVPGIIVHRARSPLPARHQTRKENVPLTSAPRTLVDLAATLSLDDLGIACHEAGVKYRTTPRHVEMILRDRPSAPGAGALRAVIHGDARVALSKLELRFLDLLHARGLPLPITNRPAGSHRVDCRWPDRKLTVELDSYRFHQSRRAWELDRRREREAYERGDEIRRYTWGDVFEDSDPMLGELTGLLHGLTS